MEAHRPMGECVLNCRPADGQPHVCFSHLEYFWHVDDLEPTGRLLGTE